MFIASLLAGGAYAGRRHPILWSVGIFLPLGLLFVVPLTLPALIGALAGAALAKRSLPAGEQ